MKHKHALVIGGTGMLSDVSAWLNKKGYIVTVIGRRNETYHKLLKKVPKPKRMKSVLVDYHNTAALTETLMERMKKDGTFDVIVAWVHRSAPEAIPAVLNLVAANRKESFDFYHVKSSTSYRNKTKIEVPSTCNLYEIYLGFKIFNNHSRWLTNKEISEGVIGSIHHKRKMTIVGELEPWEKRPH